VASELISRLQPFFLRKSFEGCFRERFFTVSRRRRSETERTENLEIPGNLRSRTSPLLPRFNLVPWIRPTAR